MKQSASHTHFPDSDGSKNLKQFFGCKNKTINLPKVFFNKNQLLIDYYKYFLFLSSLFTFHNNSIVTFHIYFQFFLFVKIIFDCTTI